MTGIRMLAIYIEKEMKLKRIQNEVYPSLFSRFVDVIFK